MLKAVFLDIDGTLIYRNKGPFPGDIGMIEAAHRQGHRIFLNTGRALANIPRTLREAPWIDGIVAGGGAHILLKGRTVYHKWMPEEIVRSVCAFYLKSGNWCVFEGETALYGINRCDRTLFAGDVLAVKDEKDFLTRYKGAVITKVTLEGTAAAADWEILGPCFQLNQFEGYFEGIIRGESKLRAMDLILEKTGISRENSVAIGDGLNDVEFVRAAGLGIAMGNACDELKAAAGALTAAFSDGGAGKALQKYVLQEAPET
jgi:hydroxymethylpyrimidine pyrophosphatase-like HAD family hydrolase